MSRFIDTLNNLTVNLDHVQYVSYERKERGPKIMELYGVHGNLLGKSYCKDLVSLTSPVVPAQPGDIAYAIAIYDDFTWGCTKYPVIAWRIEYGAATPIFCEALSENEFIVFPVDGKFVISAEDTFDTLEKAAGELARRSREREERKGGK